MAAAKENKAWVWLGVERRTLIGRSSHGRGGDGRGCLGLVFAGQAKGRERPGSGR